MSDKYSWENDKPPQRLYLQWYEEDAPHGTAAHPDERTWCVDKINDSDVCYVRFGHKSQMQTNELAELRGRAEKAEREVTLLRGAIAAQDERDLAASEKAGEPPFDCDTSDHLADVVLTLRDEIDRLNRGTP